MSLNYFLYGADDFATKFVTLLTVLLAWLLVPIMLITGTVTTASQLAGKDAIMATRREYIFDNNRLLLGGYHVAHGVRSETSAPEVTAALAKEAGLDFIIADIQDRLSPADCEILLDGYESQGLGVIMMGYNGRAFSYWAEEDMAEQWLSITQESYKSHPALWGDSMADEPRTPRFPGLQTSLEHYYSLETGRMPYINLTPYWINGSQGLWYTGLAPSSNFWRKLIMYAPPTVRRTDEWRDIYQRYVAEYIKTIDTDYISVDIYPYKYKDGSKITIDSWLENLDCLAEACRETNRDLWVITQAGGTEGDAERIPHHGEVQIPNTPAHQRQQGYASLAFGAKAIIYACLQGGWYTDNSHMLDVKGDKTATYDAVQATNAELRTFTEKFGEYQWLGAYTLNNKKVAGMKYPLTNGLKRSEHLKIDSCDGLLVGVFNEKQGSGKAYVIANMMELQDEKTAACAIEFPEGKTVTVYGGGEIKTYNGGKVELTLTPGDGRFITVK